MNYLYPITAIALMAAFSCKSPSTVRADNSRTSLDWKGSYSGVLPCADCEGILVTLTLGSDKNYSLSNTYLGKNDDSKTYAGKFSWNDAGTAITLGGLSNMPQVYRVGENRLTQMDMSGKPVTGALAERYVLGKIADSISGKYWRLTEVMGNPVTFSEAPGKAAHFMLQPSLSRVSGNGGCNNFFGTYQLSANNRIRFSRMGITQMACSDGMETERSFMEILQRADSYYISGDTLQLNRARMAPLARFVSVSPL